MATSARLAAWTCGFFVVWALGAGDTAAQFTDGTLLPTNPQAWLNSPPLSAEALQGKAVVLWFFEEDCPRCRGKWPEMYQTASKFTGQPVLFVGVNSGNPRGAVEQYAREVGLQWPVIVDTDRSFEKQCGVNEINLNNIYQAKVLTAGGQLKDGSWSDVEGTARDALAGASWRVDPSKIPAALQEAWRAVEFGSYAPAAAAIKRNLASPKPDVKAGAEALQAAVEKEINALVASATKARENGQKWQAYKSYALASEKFKGYDLPAEVREQLKSLAGDESVKMNIAAAKLMDAARRQLSNPKAAVAALQRVTRQYPESEAAKEAQELLDKSGAAR